MVKVAIRTPSCVNGGWCATLLPTGYTEPQEAPNDSRRPPQRQPDLPDPRAVAGGRGDRAAPPAGRGRRRGRRGPRQRRLALEGRHPVQGQGDRPVLEG